MRGRSLLALLAFAGVVRAQTQQNKLPAADPQKRVEFTLINADVFESTDIDTDIKVSGNIHAQCKGYDIYADRLVGNRQTQVFRLEGNARLVGKDSEITGAVVVVNFRDDTFSFEQGKAQLSPEFLQGKAQADVFLTGQGGSGTSTKFVVRNGVFTTCDKLVPHSKFVVSSTTVKPGKYAALRNARLEVLGHTIFSVPYLVIPLIENGQRYLPDVGNSPDEGSYVKTRVSTPLPGGDYFDTRLDYMSRLGPAFGVDYHYDHPSLEGRFQAYRVFGTSNSATISETHKENIGPGKLLFDANYQKQNYLTAPESTLLNTRAQYVLPWMMGNSRLSWYRVQSDRSLFSSVTQSLALADSHSWQSGFSSLLNLNLTRAESHSTSSDTQSERLDVQFTGHQELRLFSADLSYQRAVPIGGTENFFSSTDRTPMLTLKTDAQHLFRSDIARLWPIRTDFSIGNLVDPTSGDSITRMDFNLGMLRNERKGNSSLRWSGGYKQGIYSDNTAQYVLDYNVDWSYAFARRSLFEIAYRNHRAFGFTPLSIDRTGRNDALSFNFNYQVVKSLLLTARTGYDVLQADRGNVPWQQVWLQTAWIPSKNFQFKTSSTYDTFNQVWSNMRFDANYVNGDFRAGIGSRYDGRRSIWGSTSFMLQGLRIGRTTLATALDWNGFTQRFEAQHYSVIYDLHEAEAVLDIIDNQVGFRSGRQIAFFLRLKAFPTRSPFGSGTRGQAVGGGTGFGG